jgi:hypothetical protein
MKSEKSVSIRATPHLQPSQVVAGVREPRHFVAGFEASAGRLLLTDRPPKGSNPINLLTDDTDNTDTEHEIRNPCLFAQHRTCNHRRWVQVSVSSKRHGVNTTLIASSEPFARS